MKNIYLVGFMGTGKTTVGKLLSQSLNKRFVETDELIEKREGKKIVDIFAHYGEPYFRKVEKEVLKEVANQSDLVVSCGGGIVIDEENVRLLKTTGVMICLTADVECIYERTKKYTHRPLLNVDDPIKRIKELLLKREPFYKKADYFVDTSPLSCEEVVKKIVEILKDAQIIPNSS